MSSFDVVRSGRRVRRTVLLAAVAGLAGVAPAQAAVPIAGGTDDAAGDGGAADLRRVDVRFDGAGQMQLVAQLAGAPTSGNLLAVAGRSGGGTSCTAAVGAGTSLADSSPGSWYVFSASGEAQPQGQVARQVDGTVVTLTAQDPRLADTQVDCALVRIVDARGTVLDETERFSLAAQTPPPPTTTTPAPPAPPPATTPAPASPPAPATPTLAPAAPTRSGAHLELKLPQVADRGKRGITRTLRLLVTNRGTATASRPVVQLTAPKGVTVSPRRVQLASIKRAKSRSLTIRVKVSRAAKAASTVGVSVKTTSKGTAHSASGRLPLPIKRTASASPTSAAASPPPTWSARPSTPLCPTAPAVPPPTASTSKTTGGRSAAPSTAPSPPAPRARPTPTGRAASRTPTTRRLGPWWSTGSPGPTTQLSRTSSWTTRRSATSRSSRPAPPW